MTCANLVANYSWAYMENFDISNFVDGADTGERYELPDRLVVEYIGAIKKWAKECEYFLKTHKDSPHVWPEYHNGAPRHALKSLQKLFCTQKNRQYWRMTIGVYHLGGTADVNPENLLSSETKEGVCEVIFGNKKGVATYKFVVKKNNRKWLIDDLFCIVRNRWEKDQM
jgi:hypothetical protein